VLVVAAAVAIGACGSGGDSGSSGVSAATAKATVEHAAGITLAAQPIPGDAHDQGLKAAYSNAATVAKDKQVVVVFLLEDAGVADKVRDLVKGSVPAPSRLIVNGNVMVVYAANGTDHTRQVEQAVKAL
jgi:hypothetical protein